MWSQNQKEGGLFVNHMIQYHTFHRDKCEDSLIGWCVPVESQLGSKIGLYEEYIM